jgi:hypothetical protein
MIARVLKTAVYAVLWLAAFMAFITLCAWVQGG